MEYASFEPQSRQDEFSAGQSAGHYVIPYRPLANGVLSQPNRNIMGLGTSAEDQSRVIPSLTGHVMLMRSQNAMSDQTYRNNQLRMLAGQG